MNNLTKKQEQYALNLFKGMSQREAYIKAGYANNKPEIVDINAHRLSQNTKVLLRLEQLRDEAATPDIMTVKERKERLTEIARAKLTDYQESGQDGSWINVGKESPNAGAIQEITSRTEYDDNGANAAVIQRIKLHDPVRAIQELNKMDGAYAPEKRAILGDIVIEVVYKTPPETGQNEGVPHVDGDSPIRALW